MYPSTEELLSIRDGEPVDAEARAAVESEPALQAEIAHLEATRDRLRKLPELAPPPGVRAKVFLELESDPGTRRATSPERPRSRSTGQSRTASAATALGKTSGGNPGTRFLRRAQWPLRGSIAAAVALVAILGVRSLDIPQGLPPGTIIAEEPLTAVAPSGFGGAAATYTSLTIESARLERMLNDIPYRPRLVNAGTATMISGLQDRIGQVDQVLMYSSVDGLRPEQTMALWQERVDLMNALVRVRYAEAQRFGF